MGKASRDKGARWERKVSKALTKWWNEAGLEGAFYRTPASGGLRWQKREDTIGDICTPDSFTHTVEAKRSESLDYKHLIEPPKPNKNNITGWWAQAVQEAVRADRRPWLVIKKNYCKALLFFSMTDIKTKVLSKEVEHFSVVRFRIPLELDNHEEVGVYWWDEFLAVGNPEEFSI